jgi:hypothetical protein
VHSIGGSRARNRCTRPTLSMMLDAFDAPLDASGVLDLDLKEQ